MDERRYYGLDALRGGMMMLGIVLHTAMFYLAAPPPQLAMLPYDRNTSYLFDLLYHFIHSFRMPTFFVLAGFFASLLLEKRGLWRTWQNRAARVLAPLAVGLLTVVPAAMLFFADFMLSVRSGTQILIPDLGELRALTEEMRAQGHPAGRPSPAHLWFLYYLLYFYLLLPVCRFLAARSAAQPAIAKLIASPWTVALLGLYTAATLWPYRAGQVLEGFIFFKPHLPSLLYYGSFFVFGYLLHHHRDALRTWARHLGLFAALAAVLFPLSLYLSHLEYGGAGAGPGLHLAAVLAHGLCTWAFVFVFIGAALRFFDRDAPWILYISQSSYWVFLVHMPVAIFACWLLLPYDLPALVKFLLAAAFTAGVCFVTYHYWVQRTWVSVFLNGKRFDLDWPWRKQRQAVSRAG